MFSFVLPILHLPIVLNLTYHICRYLKLAVITFAPFIWVSRKGEIEAEANCRAFHTAVLTLGFPESLVAPCGDSV